MTSEYYFKQWKKTLQDLERTICIDLDYQDRRAHDKELCDAVLRLSGILGSYMACCNEALDCLQQNLQVQKTSYIQAIVKTIVARILELKEQLRKLNGSNYEYLYRGLVKHKLTPFDVELKCIPSQYIRPENLQRIVDEAILRARKISEEEISINNLKEISNGHLQTDNWWDLCDDNDREETQTKGINITAIYEVEEKISEETLTRKRLLALIQAHEKTRHTIQLNTLRQQRRILWEKELKGTLKPPAPFEIRERGAKIIQKVMRYYFKLKRKQMMDCKLDELLGIKLCKHINHVNYKEKEKQHNVHRRQLMNEYNEQWQIAFFERKTHFLKQKGDAIADDYREFIRDWFRQWFEDIQFFYAISKDNQGGLVKIIKEEVPTPFEWIELYKEYLEQKKAKKNKTTTQLKYEKMEAKREENMIKKEEIRKKKLEAELLKKIMKNPNMHPGYNFPTSKKMNHLIETIGEYKRQWYAWDELDILEVKQGFVKEIDTDNIYRQIKEEILLSIGDDMRLEYQKLMAALKEDYSRNEKEIPENIRENVKRVKNKRERKFIKEDDLQEKLYYLAAKAILMAYPITKFEDFLGDYNFAGDKLKCELKIVHPFGGEIRNMWWERCRELTHGFRRILLVGPRASGKTVLVHAMATVNKATLYNLNLLDVQKETMDQMKKVLSALLLCARATQPSVIYIRHLHKLYYRKVSVNEEIKNAAMLKRLLGKRLMKKIHKMDKITLIGSCIDPWLTKSNQITKHFPNVVLMPPTLYFTTQLILRDWVSRHRIVPPSLDLQSLARMLQGYSIGHLKKTLEAFLTPERIVRIAANGLFADEIYDYFLFNENEAKVDYDKYHKWYAEKTYWGIMEKKQLQEQIEFQKNVERWKEKNEKKKN